MFCDGYINLWIVSLYWRKRDWAGLGYEHRMIAWEWNGPRSIVLFGPDCHSNEWVAAHRN